MSKKSAKHAPRKPKPIHPSVKRLFEEGYEVKLFMNQLHSYSAVAKLHGKGRGIITDHFTPADALVQIAQKVFKEGIYAEEAA